MLTLLAEFLFAAMWLMLIVVAVGMVVFMGYMLVDWVGERVYGESPLERRMHGPR